MEPRIITLEEAIKVIGISTHTKVGSAGEDIPGLWQRYMKEGISDRVPNKRKPGTCYGISFGFQDQDKSFTYLAGEEVTSFEGIPEEFTSFEIPAVKYAVFTVKPESTNDYPEAIQGTLRYIYETWLPNSDYQLAEGAGEFELYNERSHRKENPEMDIYVPIK